MSTVNAEPVGLAARKKPDSPTLAGRNGQDRQSFLRIRRRIQQIAVIHALHGVDLDVRFLVSGEVHLRKDEQRLRAVGDIEGTIEAHRLHAAFLASGLVERVGKAYGFVINLVGQMRGQQRDRQRNGRLDLHAEFLVIVVGRHQAVNLGDRSQVVFFVQDAAPIETRQHAVVHAIPAVVLDVKIVGRNELLGAGSEDYADGRDDRLFRPPLIAESDNHGPLRRQMAFVNSAGDMLLDAEEAEIYGSVGILHRGVPFVGPSHSDGNGISGVDANVHVAASSGRMVNAAGVQAGGFQGNGLAVSRSPVENPIVLRARNGGESADEQRDQDGKTLHL